MFPPPLGLSAAYGAFFRKGVSGFQFPDRKKQSSGKPQARSGEAIESAFPVLGFQQ
jgi:hypothetical protein